MKPKARKPKFYWHGSYLGVRCDYTLPFHTTEKEREAYHRALVLVTGKYVEEIAEQAEKVAEAWLEKHRED